MDKLELLKQWIAESSSIVFYCFSLGSGGLFFERNFPG